MLRAAFVGAGTRAQSAHYPSVTRLENVSVDAVSELDESKAKTVMETYRIPRYHTDYRQMLDTMELDLVYVIMGASHMTSIALDCMNGGKHVFIEKPAGANLAESQQLLDAAEANNVYCMVGYQRRYSAVVREAMGRVRKRGDATLATGTFHKYMPDGPSWGISTLWTDVCHVIDLVRYMVGSEAVEIHAYQDSHAWGWTHCYTALIRFANNAVGVITANRSSGSRYLRMELHGTGVGCYIQLPDPLEVYEEGGEPEILTGAELSGADPDDRPSYDGVLAMHRHLEECIREGKTPLTDIRDVIKTSELVQQIEGQEDTAAIWQ